MKSLFACVSLSLISACSFAAEPSASADNIESCVAPVLPPVSTSSFGVNRVQKTIVKWNDCVAAQPTEENILRDAEFKVKVAQWVDASLGYIGGRYAGVVANGRRDYERFDTRIAFDEREKFRALSRPADFDRVDNMSM